MLFGLIWFHHVIPHGNEAFRNFWSRNIYCLHSTGDILDCWDWQGTTSGNRLAAAVKLGNNHIQKRDFPNKCRNYITGWWYTPLKNDGVRQLGCPGGNLPQNLWTYPTAWHTAYPTTPRTYAMCKSPWHTGPHGQVFGLVCYFPKGFGTFYISSWILWPHPKCQGTHGTPTNCFLSPQVLRCNSHCRNNIFNL